MGANGKGNNKCFFAKKFFGKKATAVDNNGSTTDDVDDPNNVRVEDNKSVSYFTLFALADKHDKIILAIGVTAALINGALMPLFSLLFGNFADAAAGGIAGFMHRISKVAWEMCVLGAISFVAASIFNACFSYFSENQVTRLRVKYLQAVVGQDIAWFDVRTPAALPARMSEDVLKVRDAIGQKASMMCMNVSMCIVGYIIAFYRGWQITLVMIATCPLIMVCGLFMAKAMSTLASKGQNEYAEAGAVAEEVLSSIKTVASFGGEQRSIDRYNAKVQKALKSGVKVSVYRGFAIGFTMLVVFWTYALTFWYGGTLIRDRTINPSTGRPYQGGDVLTVFMSAMMATFSIAQIAPHFQAFSEGCAAGGKIFPLMAENAEIEPKVKRLSEGGEAEANMIPVEFQSLQLDDVKFNYPARPTLQ
ncbi:multidrug resistance protein, putative, partial [Perkinsus marinus ATCC 50983]